MKLTEEQNQIEEAAEYLRERLVHVPHIAAVAGSGLSGLENVLHSPLVRINYCNIPHMPCSGISGHCGELLCGTLNPQDATEEQASLLILSGRTHIYEGHAASRVIFAVRVLARLSVRVLILTNAAGGLNPDFRVGDLMLMRDHINLSFRAPLIGSRSEVANPFPDLCDACDPALAAQALETARRLCIPMRQGTYAMMAGPNYETRAEIAMLRRLGGDAVGMSTVPEILAAREAGMRVLAVSLITNVCSEQPAGCVSHDEVLSAGRAAAKQMSRLIAQMTLQDTSGGLHTRLE